VKVLKNIDSKTFSAMYSYTKVIPKLLKRMNVNKKILVHNCSGSLLSEGGTVEIHQCRRISKRKSYMLCL